ncbi:GNAT superfamily N-acetyltransferase [Rhizomicrobium palustre]|uniref:GNAT superfamily N-acetyltransferase n=1 Tax=Rhizomicrobium palustre TaxID=189966 RepID=A0A846MUT7_9PROT|nr:GNAT family N-acetyltransferase [Rhizomicrobium palustre]NIK86995.1 GNAT superfamily N-acetyltransferase [Rhizomicrobium palustre]
MALTIRKAGPQDVKTLVRLNRPVQALHHDAQDWLFKAETEDAALEAYFASVIANPTHTILMAFWDEEAAGYLFYEARERPASLLTKANRSLFIHHLSVDEVHRRKGIGRVLMAAVDLAADGFDFVEVDFWSFNGEAREFYAACGYGVSRERWWKRR